MKFVVAFVYFVAVFGAMAESKLAPLPSLIIICSSNQPAPITIIYTSTDGRKDDYIKQQLVITNLHLTCMSVKSITFKDDKTRVLVVLHEATAYGPFITDGEYGRDQKLMRMMVEDLSIGLLKSDLIQVNGEIISAGKIAKRFKTIPDKGTK